MSNEPQALTQGVHHVGLAIPDIEVTRSFFVEALGYHEVARRADYPAVFVSDGETLLTLWQLRCAQEDAHPFDRLRNAGLHHLALKVRDDAALEALHDRLAARPDVEIEFAPEDLGTSGLRHLMCRVPGGIRLELVATTQEASP